jgi:hypothetical protein
MKGLFKQLTSEQQKAALAYDGPENFGVADRMILHAVKCVRCGADYGRCNCWDQVKLHCPGCGATKKATRAVSDPPGAKVVELACPKCWDSVNAAGQSVRE